MRPIWGTAGHARAPRPAAGLLLRRDSSGSSSGQGAQDAPDHRSSARNQPLDPISSPAPAPPTEPRSPGPAPAEADVPLWMQRVSIVVFVIFCIELGMVLAILPWRPEWTSNSLLEGYPGLRALMERNFVRGAVSGLGLVNIWIGIWEAVRYRESRRK